MADLVLDTHALVFFLERSPQLSPTARHAIRNALDAQDRVLVSTVSLVELIYLADHRRIDPAIRDRIFDALLQQNLGIDVLAFEAPMAIAMQQIPRDRIPDMPDRMITATALHLGLPLVTKDQKIQHANVIPTIW